MNEHILQYLACVLALGIAAQWLAWKLRLPSILLLLGFGFIARYLAERWLGAADQFIDQELLFAIVSLSVAVILFEGGLSLQISELKEAGKSLFRLVSVGAAVTWVLTTLAAKYLLGFDWYTATLQGAILVVTGPTVIAPLLRHVRPHRRVGSIAKWEGIVIDPIGAVLAVLVFEAILVGSARDALTHALWGFFYTAAVGGVIGAISALLLMQLLKRFLIPDFLHSAFFLAVVLGVFALSNHLQPESGLVTVTVLGIILANQKTAPVRHVVEFKENLRVLLISTLFIVLASRIQIQDLFELRYQGLFFLAVLILIIRPLSVLIALAWSELNMRERIFLSFLAPRGIVAAAVSSVFALEVALLAKKQESAEETHHAIGALPPDMIENAAQLVPVTFFVIVGTVAIYGLLARPMARWLALAEPHPQGILFAGASPWIIPIAKAVQDEGYQVLLVDTNYGHTASARMAGLPTHCASILSEYVSEELEFNGIGRLLAMTANDEVNTLASQEFSHLFTRQEVYQLPPWDSGAGRRSSVSEHLHGRLLFEPEVTYGHLAQRFSTGAQIKKTTLTEEFSYEDFVTRYGETSLILFVIDESGKLNICTTERTQTPTPGQSLITMIEPVESEENGNSSTEEPI